MWSLNLIDFFSSKCLKHVWTCLHSTVLMDTQTERLNSAFKAKGVCSAFVHNKSKYWELFTVTESICGGRRLHYWDRAWQSLFSLRVKKIALLGLQRRFMYLALCHDAYIYMPGAFSEEDTRIFPSNSVNFCPIFKIFFLLKARKKSSCLKI